MITLLHNPWMRPGRTWKNARILFRDLPRCLSSRESGSHGNVVKSPFSEVPQPSGNLVRTVFEHFQRYGSQTAIECAVTGKSYTYDHLLETVSRWAGFLTRLGISKGDVIAVYMPNCPEYPVVLFGSISVGVVVTTVSNHYTSEELDRQLNDSKAKLLVSAPSLDSKVMSSLERQKSPLPVVMNGPSRIPGALDLLKILEDPKTPSADVVEVSNKDLALMPYSSGTTGNPKGVAISHGALSMNIRMFTHPSLFCTPMATEKYRSKYLCVLPFYHIYGMLVNCVIGLHAGAKLVTVPAFEPNLYISTLKKHEFDMIHLVPPLLNFLVKSPEVTRDVLSSVKSMLVGAAPVSPTEAKAFKAKFSEDIFVQEGYGMTEMLITNLTPVGKERLGTSGQLLPNISAKIINTSTGEVLPPSHTGEVCFKTPGMMTGYFQNKAATSSTVDEEGWLHTGDVGFFDEEGFMKIVDRTKELIKVKGLQVSPSEIEDVLRRHPKVLDVGVVGVPHERLGEAPRAYVITKEGVSGDDIHRFLEDRLAPHKKLTGGVTFVKALPKSASGKLLRRELKNMAQ
ncbi:probable 4-coumarate--CoA ligase 3 isoform X3 [Macrobrachium rosenbergii]